MFTDLGKDPSTALTQSSCTRGSCGSGGAIAGTYSIVNVVSCTKKRGMATTTTASHNVSNCCGHATCLCYRHKQYKETM